MASEVRNITDGDFDLEVLQSSEPVLVDFWAAWCPPCRALDPVIDGLAAQYAGTVKFSKMDVDQHQHVPEQYGIRSIPTLLLFKGGKVVAQIFGAAPRLKLEEALRKALSADVPGYRASQKP